ncbi:MAG: discoidin domain-containing protein, partial [Candidatus Omnitrophica bacterium]|nr:discoidin domain-containing protein [Candidatus Omnitrophota bacterium]
FSPVKAQFVRIRGIRSDSTSNFYIEEVRIYPPKGWPVTSFVTRRFNIQGDILAEFQTGGRAESFTYDKDALENVTRVLEAHHQADRKAVIKQVKGNGGNTITQLTDGNRTTEATFYRVNNQEPYVDFELKEPTEIREVRILFSDYNESYRYFYWVDVSENGSSWTRVHNHIQASERSWQRVTFNPVRAKFVRVGGYEDNDPNFLNMHEVEIYGSSLGPVEYTTSRLIDQEVLPTQSIHPMSANGDAQIDTDQFKFGGSSAFFDGGPSPYDYISTPDGTDFDFGTGDFTIDTWVRFSSWDKVHTIVSKYVGAVGWIFVVTPASNPTNGVMRLYNSGNTSVAVEGSQVPGGIAFDLNQWYHVAVVRTGNKVKFFKDGIQQGSDQLVANTGRMTFDGAATPLTVGIYEGTSPFHGWIDELRISKGIARWTQNFDAELPTQQEYTPDQYTKLLAHFNGEDASTRFEDSSLQTKVYVSKEGQVTASIDRQGKLTRYAYEYDAIGNQTGSYQMTERGTGLNSATEFQGEVRDTFGRVIRQISDSGEVSYFNYELDAFGNVRKAYVRDSSPETVTVRPNLLQSGLNNVAITGDTWTNIQFQTGPKTNYLFDGKTDTSGYVYVSNDEQKPITFDFTGVPSPRAVGDVQLDTDSSRFGGSSAYFDGNGDYLETADSTDFDLGVDNFTIDTWVKLAERDSSYHIIAEKFTGGQSGYTLYTYGDGRVYFYVDSNSIELTSSTLLSLNEWHHIAVVRSGNSWKLFIDGMNEASITSNYAVSYQATPFKIGSRNGTGIWFKGSMDEFRFSKGIARWTTDFSNQLPQENTPDQYTKLLLHFNGSDGSKTFTNHNFTPPKTVDISRVRFYTDARPNMGYKIEVSYDGLNWSTVVDHSTGGVKAEWNDHEFSANGVQKLRIVPVGYDYLYIYEMQIFGSLSSPNALIGDPWIPASAGMTINGVPRNFQIVREYDFRGNILSEENLLYHIWKSRPELQIYFPDPQKKGIWGRWKDKTIADWAREEGWLEDPRLIRYTPQLEIPTPDLKDAFDARRELQRRFTDDVNLRDWAERFGSADDPRLSAYDPGRIPSYGPPEGEANIPLEPVGPTTTETVTNPDSTTTTTVRDSLGVFRIEAKDSSGRTTSVTERKRDVNSGFGSGVSVKADATVTNSVYKFGGGSAAFDGSGDYVSTPNSSDLDFGTEDFTVDLWVRFDRVGPGYFVGRQTGSTNAADLYYDGATLKFFIMGTTAVEAVFPFNPNQWYHVAAVRSGTQCYLFIDGVQKGATGTNSSNISGTAGYQIGAWGGAAPFFNGWMDEIRISKGIARAFSPSTLPTQEYTEPPDSYTKLLLHFNGYRYGVENTSYSPPDGQGVITITTTDENGVLVREEKKDSLNRSTEIKERAPEINSGFGNGVGVNGNAQVTHTQSRFGGASAAFDGTGDYVTVPNSTDFNVGTGDFTVEFWWNTTHLTPNVTQGLFDIGSYNDGKGISAYFVGNDLQVYLNGGGPAYINPYTRPINQWVHFAISRSGGVLRFFADGIQIGSAVPNSTNIQTASYNATIGKFLTNYFTGYIDEFHFSASGRSSNFTPPAQEYTSDSYTKLLLHFNGYRYKTQRTSYTAIGGGDTLITATDELGLLRVEKRDASNRVTYVKERTGSENVALGQQVTTNTVYYGSSSYSPSKAVDGNFPTTYPGGGGSTPITWIGHPGTTGWLEIDLGREETVQRIDLDTWYYSDIIAQNYDLWVSRDGKIWEFVKGERGLNQPARVMSYLFSEIFGQPEKTIRYVKLTNVNGGNTAGTPYYPIMGEVMVFANRYKEELITYKLDGSGNTVKTVWEIQQYTQPKPEPFRASQQWNVGSAYPNDNAWSAIQYETGGRQVDLVDMNHDGLPDRVWHAYESGAYQPYWYVQINNGSGFSAAERWDIQTPYPNDGSWSALNYETSGRQVDLVDIDGDGLPDRIWHAYESGYQSYWWVQKNTGTGFSTREQWNVQFTNSPYGIQPDAALRHELYGALKVDLIDIDGDGDLDRVYQNYQNANWQPSWTVQRNNGANKFGAPEEWAVWVPPSLPQGMFYDSALRYESGSSVFLDLIDINGDNKPDRIYQMYDASASPAWKPYWMVQINNGNGFNPPKQWNIEAATGYPDGYQIDNSIRYRPGGATYIDLVDMNGDGRLDRVYHAYDSANGGWQPTWMVQLNNGSDENGFDPAVPWAVSFPQSYPQGRGLDDALRFETNGVVYVDLIDVNGDNRPDRIYHAYENGYYQPYWMVQINNGSGFDPAKPWYVQTTGTGEDFGWKGAAISSRSTPIQMSLIDMNGDHLPDRVVHAYQYESGQYQPYWWVQLNQWGAPVPPTETKAIKVSEEVITPQGSVISKTFRSSMGNVARNKPVTVSSEYNSTYGALRVVDGVYSEPGLWYSSGANGREHSAQVDLGRVLGISKIKLDTFWNVDSYVSDFNVKISSDGTTWETVAIEHGLSNGRKWEYEVPDKQARFVRIDGIRGRNGLGAPYYGFLRELEVFASETLNVGIQEVRDSGGKLTKLIESVKEFQELSLGKVAKATSQMDSSSYDAMKALDGNPDTLWRSYYSYVNENAFVIDLEQQREITEVRVLGKTSSLDYLKSFRISTSTDGANWDVAAEPSGGTEPKEWVVDVRRVISFFGFPVRIARQARYVRIDKIDAASPGGSYQYDFLSEVRVFGYVPVTIEREFDAQGRVIRETRMGGREQGSVEYDYHANGQISEIRRYGPAVEEWKPLLFDNVGTSFKESIDGNPNTYGYLWWGAGTPPPSFVVKLDHVATVGMTRFLMGGDALPYLVEASRDGINWFTVVDQTSNAKSADSNWQEDYFPAVEALYFRITGGRDMVNNQAQALYEFEAYGPLAVPIPVSVSRFDEFSRSFAEENALYLIWKSNPSLQVLFPNPLEKSTRSGRWQGKTLIDWAREEGYKHYHALASYAPATTPSQSGANRDANLLPGLRQVFDENRALQDRFRKNGTKDTDLIQYARNRGYREDSRLQYYGPFSPLQEVARRNTFETKFDRFGNQSILIARDENGARNWRRFGADGRILEDKDELVLIWEERGDLHRIYPSSGEIRSWAVNTGFKDPAYARALSDYSPYGIGGSNTD